MDTFTELAKLVPNVPTIFLGIIAVAAWRISARLTKINTSLDAGASWMQKHEPMIEQAHRELPVISSRLGRIEDDIKELKGN